MQLAFVVNMVGLQGPCSLDHLVRVSTVVLIVSNQGGGHGNPSWQIKIKMITLRQKKSDIFHKHPPCPDQLNHFIIYGKFQILWYNNIKFYF